MKKLLIFFLLLFSFPALAAQHIQRASIDFLMASPEALDAISHAEIWVFKSTVDGGYYTAVRGLIDESNGGVTRECILWKRGQLPLEPLVKRFHLWTLFYTNGQNIMDTAMLDWCIQ